MKSSPKCPCPSCGRPMCAGSKGCRKCYHGGRPRAPDHAYAAELGISVRQLRRLGNPERLRSLAPEIRALILKPSSPVDSQTVLKGGLRARGMFTRTPARLTQPQP